MQVYTISQALDKMRAYCVVQERCMQEIRQKLYQLKMWGEETEEVIAQLITEDFLNEERFARSFCRGKFRINQWGRKKITFELKSKNISSICIRKGLEEISEEDYLQTLQSLIDKRINLVSASNIEKQKTAQYLIGKGFEPEIVFQLLH